MFDKQYTRALQLLESGDEQAAVFVLRSIVVSDPHHGDALNDLGCLAFQHGDLDEAVRLLERAVSAKPGDQTILGNFEAILASITDEPSKLEVPSAPIAIDRAKLSRWEESIRAVTSKVSATAASLLPEGGVLLDVGANVGLFTEQVLAQKRCKAYLFEPVPEYFEYCRQKFAHRSDVVVENLALSDAPGSLELWLGAENLGWNTLVREKADATMTPTVVPAVTFDEYARRAGIDRIDVIKIDVEGGEYKVLSGMRETLARLEKKPFIVCEIGWGPASHPQWAKEVEAFEWLFANGYERLDYNVPGTSDVIFVPKKKTESRVVSAAGSKAPMVTLGIPTRNRLEPLLELLRSVEIQSYKNIDLLISDDGDTYDLRAEISRALPNLKFRVVKGPRKNLPANRQNIIDNARTELVVMCDDDHSMKSDCVEELVGTILRDDRIGIVSAIWPHPHENPRTVNFDEVCRDDEFRLDLDNISESSDFWWKNGTEMFKAFQDQPRIFESQFAGGGCLIYRRSAVQLAGGFPSDMTVVSFREDTDMSHRIYLKGFRILVNAQAIAYHLCATTGGCRDTESWSENFVRDGLRFLNRLSLWREEAHQLNEVAKKTIRVALFYDEKGWAWWHRAHQLKRVMPAGIELEILKLGTYFDHTQYDFIFPFDYNVLREIPPIPPEKLIVGNSCPKLMEGALQLLNEGKAHALVVNNRDAMLSTGRVGRIFCCQNGVDTTLFVPSSSPGNSEFTVAWTGHSQSIGNKGLELIQEACRREGVKLLVLDAKDRPKGEEPRTQEWVRDNIYAQASVYICASEWEGTPNPALEAMACGVPVIATRVGNMPELIVDGYNGYLVDRSVESIVSAIKAIRLADHRKMGEHARETIELGWSWEEQGEKYVSMFRSLYRERLYGVRHPRSIPQSEIDHLVEHRMPNADRFPPWQRYATGQDGKFFFLNTEFLQGKTPEEALRRAVTALATIPPFFFHFGGVGDALLLLSTFYDRDPEQVVVSCATSVPALTEFFKEFPKLKQVFVIPFPESAMELSFLRTIMPHIPNCLGRGVTPGGAHAAEWLPGVNIFHQYGVKRDPNWVREFGVERVAPRQVVVAPKGSQLDMTAGKANIIDPSLWFELCQEILQSGATPVIIGTPAERESYPCPPGAIDQRSYSFASQMRLISGSELLIGADSWAKTYAALAGVPAIVFAPMFGAAHGGVVDASANVFLHPWPEITVVRNMSEVRAALLRRGKTAATSGIETHPA